MHKLLIIGAGGHGKAVADAALESDTYSDIIFLDDAWPMRQMNSAWKIHGDTTKISAWKDECTAAVVALGNNKLRMQMQQRLAAAGCAIATIIHPSAQISRQAKIGAGSVILANSVISVDAILGKAVIINTSSTVDHDCELGDGVHIAPGSHLGGNVAVGDLTWIGMGCTIKPGTKVAGNLVIEPGTVITSNIQVN